MRIVPSSSRSRNHTGTLSGRPSGRTVVSHAIRLARNRPSTWARRSSGRCDVSFMEGILSDVPSVTVEVGGRLGLAAQGAAELFGGEDFDVGAKGEKGLSAEVGAE